MEKEIWNIVRATDFKNVSYPSKIRILDIGCGPGNAFFHFFVNFGTSNFTGIEMNCLSQIKVGLYEFKDYGNKKLCDCLYEHFIKNQDTIDPYFYFQKLIEYKILNPNPKVNKNEFKSLFLDKIHWGTKIEESKIFENTSSKFDLIILSKVLHYKDIDNPDFVIKNCMNLLTEDGLIFIKSRKTEESNKSNILNNPKKRELRKVNEKIFVKWTKNLKEFKEIEDDCEFLYFLGTKYYTVPKK